MGFVRLTGRPAAMVGGDEVPFSPDKRFQLLGYLAYAGGWVGRERVAFLFWPDSATSTSRQNLRGLLQRLDTLPFRPEIEATKHQLRWEVPNDVATFNEAIARGDVAAALAAYQGPLLREVGGDAGDEFDGWLEIEREQLYSRWRSLALTRIADLGPEGEAEEADLFRRLLEADPLDEEAVRAHMRALTRWGRPAAAVRAYRELAARLERELGMDPSSETVFAYEEAQEAAAAPSRVPAVRATPYRHEEAAGPLGPAATPAETAYRALPTPTTSFVGREVELEEVSALLEDPGCRLLSLTGPGGVGKTRLALAAACRQAQERGVEVAFVPLEAVVSPEGVLPAIASALGVGSAAGADPWEAIRRRVSDTGLLVVVDNFEQVVEAAPVLARLLEVGSGLKLLVTTRERLGLEAEWTYLVGGLDYPADDVPFAELERYAAVRLLVERARRVRPGYRLIEDDLPHLRRLFALTQGLPLAIELVAAWLRAVPLATLVAELELDPGGITAANADARQRHESVRAVFEQSWSRLTDAERQVMRRLSVFAGPVAPEAAAYVAGANRTVLAALVDKSLLRLTSDGRYDRHPLLLAFARERLAARPEEQRAVLERHSAYYLRFLRERTDRVKGPRPALVQREIEAEVTDILAAVRRAAERGANAELIAFMQLLELELGYFQAHGHDDETLDLLSRAAEAAVATGALEVARDLRGRVGDAYGVHRGDPRRALAEYEAAIELAHRTGDRGREAVLTSMAGAMRDQVSAGSGREALDRALALATESGDAVALSIVYEHRAFVVARSGDLEGARELYVRSRETVEHVTDQEAVHPFELTRRRFFATINVGHIDHAVGRFDDALAARNAALGLARQAGNQIWEAMAHLELGEMLVGAGREGEALEHLRLALDLSVANHVSSLIERLERLAGRHGHDLGT